MQEYDKALEKYSEAIATCPHHAKYYSNRAACLMMMGEYQKALVDARYCLQLDDKFEKGYIRVLKCCIALGDLFGAENAVKKLQELDPTNNAIAPDIEILAKLREFEENSKIYLENETYSMCIFLMERALKMAPACIRYQLLKAECLAMMIDPDRVQEINDIIACVVKVEPSNPDAVYIQALTVYFSGGLSKSIDEFKRVLSLDPDHKKAKKMWKRAKSLKESKDKGEELFKAGYYCQAFTVYTEALELDPRNKRVNSKLHFNRALIKSKMGNLNDALQDCNTAIRMDQKYFKAISMRAKLFFRMKKYADCIQNCEAALKLESSSEMVNLLRDAKKELNRPKRKDHYKILGVSRNASMDEIKTAYYKQAKLHHPDRHITASEGERKKQEVIFKEIGEAYAVLSDYFKRVQYDRVNSSDTDDTDTEPESDVEYEE